MQPTIGRHTTTAKIGFSSSRSSFLCWLVLLLLDFRGNVLADLAAEQQPVGRFFESYCTECHGSKKAKGKVTLHEFSLARGSADDLKLWERVLDALKGGEMPPEDETKQPTAKERAEISTLLDAALRKQTTNPVGNDAHVATRRLTNFEYENTMRDLLGVPLRLKGSLPEDPVKPYHFNNSAEFMLIGPEQIERYLECARRALASTIVEPAKPEVRRVKREWKPEGDRSAIGSDEVPIWGNRRNTAATGMNVDNPPRTGEFVIRFVAGRD